MAAATSGTLRGVRSLLVAMVLAALAGAPAAQAFEVRVVAADGGGGRAIGGVTAAFGPAWSPDGSRIAFFGVPAGGAALQVLLAEGDRVVPVTGVDGDDGAGLAWSPDATRLAFAAGDPGGLGTRLFVVGADGTGLRTLAGTVNEDFPTPSWSPDGTRLTFLRGESDRSRLAVVNADGSGLRTLRRVVLDTNEGGLPRWSPDGRRIAYVDARRGRFVVFTVRPDGRGVRRVGNRCGLDPAWRPDGRALACAGLVRRGGKPRLGINVVRPDGRLVRSLPAGGAGALDGSPAWSPDGTRLTYLRARGARRALYVIGADGRGKRLLTSRPSAFLPVYPVAWSPDGTQIAFGTGQLPGG